jgi:hypothetical protein
MSTEATRTVIDATNKFRSSALGTANASAQFREMIAIHGNADIIADALIDHVSKGNLEEFSAADITTWLTECVDAGADAERIRALAQGRLDAQYFRNENQESLEHLVKTVRALMAERHIEAGSLEARIA